MMTFFSVLLAVLLVQITFAQKTVQVFGQCPNVAVSTMEVSKLFSECQGLFQFNCTIAPCQLKPGYFSCRRATEPCRTSTPGPPPPKFVFETLKVGAPVSVFINLDVRRVPVDFYLLADATGSMQKSIANVQNQFNKLIEQFNDNPLVTNARYGVGMYRDETQLDNGFANIQSLTFNSADAKAAVKKLIPDRGGDSEEANLVGLHRVATDPNIGWDDKRRKILVYFGDWVGHEPTCGKYGKLTRESVATDLKNKNITVIGMSTPDSSGGFFFDAAPREPASTATYKCPGPFPNPGPLQSTYITRETGGSFQKVTKPDDLVKRIVETLQKLKSTFTVDASSCAGKLQLTYKPPVPITLSPGSSTLVKQTTKVPDGYCTASRSRKFTCKLDYFESGVKRPPTLIEVKQVVGCP